MEEVSLPSAEDIRSMIHEWDPKLAEESEWFQAALVMFSALYLGTGHGAALRLSKFTGVRYERVLWFRKNLLAAGIWKDGKTTCTWDDPESGELSFWVDVGIACGDLESSKPELAVPHDA